MYYYDNEIAMLEVGLQGTDWLYNYTEYSTNHRESTKMQCCVQGSAPFLKCDYNWLNIMVTQR